MFADFTSGVMSRLNLQQCALVAIGEDQMELDYLGMYHQSVGMYPVNKHNVLVLHGPF